jgi:hypothetical protein
MEARYLTDDKGKRVGVIIDIAEYERLRDIEDEMEDIRRYDEAMAARERGESDAVRRRGLAPSEGLSMRRDDAGKDI